MLTVLRREEKYVMELQEAKRFEHIFSQVLMTDRFSADGSYTVRSLYFDTLDDKDFFDKITEQNYRRKIRLRIYSPADQTVKLELKQKENTYQKKRSLMISRPDALNLIAGNFSVLLQYSEPFAAELYFIMTSEGYRPKTMIEYQRRAFIAKENNIRLTFDSKIMATEGNLDLFAEEPGYAPVFDPNRVIFEVKYDRFLLGYIADLLQQIDRKNITASKYCMGRSLGYPLYL